MSGKDTKQYFQKPWNCAFASAMIVGFVTHLYALTNNLQNYDNIAQQPTGYGVGITSGRWLLSVMGDCSQFGGVITTSRW